MLDADLCRMKAQVLGVNVSQLSALCGVPPSKLSLFFGNTKGLRNHEVTQIREALADLEQLVETAQPYPLSFRDTDRIRDLISQMKRQELRSGKEQP